MDDARARVHAGLRYDDWPELQLAFAAWSEGDARTMVEVCLGSLGMVGRAGVEHQGRRFWAVPNPDGVLHVVHDPTRGEIAVEAAIISLPARLAVPAMLSLLHMNARRAGGARFCLRDQLVVLRFASRLASCPPPQLVESIREVGARAGAATLALSEAYFAQPAHISARSALDPETLGSQRVLKVLGDNTGGSTARASGSSIPPFREASQPWRASTAPERSTPTTAEHAPRSARSALMAEADQRLERATAFANLMTEAKSRSRDHDEARSVLVQRAALFRAQHEHGAALPHAIAYLFGAGKSVVDRPPRPRARGLFGLASGPLVDPGLGSILPPVFERLARDLGDVPPPASDTAPAKLPPGQLKAHVREQLELVETLELDAATKAFVLLGVTAETLSRASFSEAASTQLSAAYRAALGEPPLRAVATLRHLLTRVAA